MAGPNTVQFLGISKSLGTAQTSGTQQDPTSGVKTQSRMPVGGEELWWTLDLPRCVSRNQVSSVSYCHGHRQYLTYNSDPGDLFYSDALIEDSKLVVLTVRNYSRWQDVSMHRMEMISHFSERRFLQEVDYLVCADVDMKFQDHVGVEILSALFGTLHPGFYRSSREAFTYERRPKSQAYIPRDEGDFYYAGGFFGGSVVEVHRLTKACHQAMVEDKANGIEAVWHDESYLNKYLLYHKPTKVLSPEYVWDQKLLGWPSVMKKLRYVAVPKNHQAIRNR
ncbi:histo-blood group ABO system transferase 1-like [Alexandromys fortis]|uniref:histo-blood group ABO system transferase 1-like n=1 Tax=Alexandromys fortis TaxID=100897 RepID=UPI002152F1A9|nr:histo-blood group ABO system transferase 1-like [Microtus fortis]